MAGRADGSAKKALFSPNKGDPPPQVKKEGESPCDKNALPPDQTQKKEKSPPKKQPSPDKNASTKSPNEKEKVEKNENSWTAPPKIQVDVDDLLQRAKAISSEVQEHGLMFNLEEVRQDQKKRTVSVFVVDKRSRKIVKPAKDMVLRQISSLGVKAQAIIAGASYAFWDILLPTTEEAVALTKKSLENKEYFFRTEYMGRRQATVLIYEVPSFLRDANLAAYMLQFGDIVSATHDGMRGEWRFDIMLDMKTFYSVPNWLEVEGRRLPVIVSGRKPTCWHCGEIGHLSAVCPGKKAPKKPDHKHDTLSPVVKSNTEKEAPVVSPTPAGKKNSTPPSSPTVNSEEAKAEWLTVRKGGRKLQPEDPRSQKSSQVGTDSSTPSKKSNSPPISSAQKSSPKHILPPKTPPKQRTPPKVRCFSPGREKFEKLLEFKKRLDQERKSSPRPGPPHSTPSSPRHRIIRPPPTTPPHRPMPPPLMSVLVPKKKGPIPPPLPLESPPTKPAPPVTAAASPSTTPKKRQMRSQNTSKKKKSHAITPG